MQSQSHQHRFSFLEKKRQKALRQIRTRRQQLFQKSRKMLQDEQESQSQTNQQFLDKQCPTNFSDMIDQQPIQSTVSEHNSIINKVSVDKIPKKKYKLRYNFHVKKLFQIPDWMNQIPEQLNQFYGAARPNGITVLLMIQNSNQLKVYDKLGAQIASFRMKGKNFNNTILQGFLIKTKNQMQQQKCDYHLIVSDMICWKKNIYTTESFQFRYSWLQANLYSIAASLTGGTISLLPYAIVSKQSLVQIYNNDFGFEKEGLYFIHKDSFYLHGNNANALIWKDYKTSKYPIDQTEDNQIHGIGFLKKNGTVVTSDDFQIGKINQSSVIGTNKSFIRFRIKGINFQSHYHGKQYVQLSDFEPIGIKKLHHSRADSLSRIIFQYRARNDPLTIQSIFSSLQ